MSVPGSNRNPYRAPCPGTVLCGSGPRYQNARASEQNIPVYLYDAVVPDYATEDNYIPPYTRPVALNLCTGAPCAGTDTCPDPTSASPPCIGWMTNQVGDPSCTYSNVAGAANPVPVSWYQPMMLTAVSIADGGENYQVGDQLSLAGGDVSAYVGNQSGGASVQVTAVNESGAITGAVIFSHGSYQTNPGSPNSPTGGHGSGASFNLTFGGQTMDF